MFFIKHRKIVLVSFALVVAVMVAAPALAGIKVDAVSNGVAMFKVGEGDWAPLRMGSPLEPGMNIRVLQDAHVSVFHDESTRWAFYEGSMSLKSGNESTPPTVIIEMEKGVFLLNQGETEGESEPFRIEFGELGIECLPGIFAVVAGAEGELEAAAGKGEVCLESGGEKKVRECAKSGWTIAYDPEKKTFEKFQKVMPDIYRLWGRMKWPVSKESPDLKVVRPAEGAFFNSSSIFVSGNATPGSKIWVNNTEIPTGDNGSFSGTVSLYEGENRIIVEARSPSGGIATVTRSVFLDSVPPLLSISQPSDNFDMSLMGRCDNRYCYIQIFGLTEPGVALLVNGIDASRYIEDDGSFLIDEFPVRLEERTLTIEVEDSLGHRTVEILYMAEPQDSDNDGIPDTIDACPLDETCQ